MRGNHALWLIVALAGCGGAYSTDPPAPPPPPPPGDGTPSAMANVAMTKTGDGYGGDVNAFNPSAVTITRSGTVTWTNNSGLVHNVTFGVATGAPANVPDLASGSASRTFTTAGTFAYQCTNHPGMTGSVVVQ
jgi:plastocyanin